MKFFWVFNRQRGRANTSSLYPVWYWQALTVCLGAWWSPWVRNGINSFTFFYLSFLREGFKVSRCEQVRQELDLIRHSSVHTEVISGPAHSHTRCKLFPLGKGQINSLSSQSVKVTCWYYVLCICPELGISLVSLPFISDKSGSGNSLEEEFPW